MQKHGKDWMNRRLLEVAEVEKPDLMFTVLFTEELDKAVVRNDLRGSDTVYSELVLRMIIGGSIISLATGLLASLGGHHGEERLAQVQEIGYKMSLEPVGMQSLSVSQN